MKVLKYIVKIIFGLAIIALMMLGLKHLKDFATEPEVAYLQGQMEARRVMIAGKVPGRLERIFIREGDLVKKGDLVAVLYSPEIAAKKQQAKGALAAAQAQASKANTGARTEEIAAAKAMADRAQDAANLAKSTYERVQKLYDQGVLPLQKRDEAETQMKASASAAAAAKAQYEMAQSGARNEDKAAANALVMQARGANAEVDAYLEETKIIAPIDGEITLKSAEEGEVVGAGMPVAAVTDMEDSWAIFNVREDMLVNIQKGKKLNVQIPAIGNKKVAMEIYYIAAAGDYATWRSSKESGGFDLKTFEIRLRPENPVEGLRPGMTVLLPVSELGNRI